jgi:hypothetical protein
LARAWGAHGAPRPYPPEKPRPHRTWPTRAGAIGEGAAAGGGGRVGGWAAGRVAGEGVEEPPAQAGWHAFLTGWVAADILNPLMMGFMNASSAAMLRTSKNDAHFIAGLRNGGCIPRCVCIAQRRAVCRPWYLYGTGVRLRRCGDRGHGASRPATDGEYMRRVLSVGSAPNTFEPGYTHSSAGRHSCTHSAPHRHSRVVSLYRVTRLMVPRMTMRSKDIPPTADWYRILVWPKERMEAWHYVCLTARVPARLGGRDAQAHASMMTPTVAQSSAD